MSKAKPYAPTFSQASAPVKGRLLYIFLIPLVIAVVLALVKIEIKSFILNGMSFLLFLAVLTLAKKGFQQEYTYNNTTFTKAPKLPYKMFAGYLLGLATFFASYVAGGQFIVESLFLSIMSTIGFYLFYGFDPKKDKLENLGDISSEFALETLNEAKIKLQNIKKDMLQIKEHILHTKLTKAANKASQIIETLQSDPKDIRVARKFLIVYLDGLAKVTKSYTELDEVAIEKKTRDKLHTLMDELENTFDKKLKRLKNNNAFDLDVHMDVLKAQIKN